MNTELSQSTNFTSFISSNNDKPSSMKFIADKHKSDILKNLLNSKLLQNFTVKDGSHSSNRHLAEDSFILTAPNNNTTIHLTIKSPDENLIEIYLESNQKIDLNLLAKITSPIYGNKKFSITHHTAGTPNNDDTFFMLDTEITQKHSYTLQEKSLSNYFDSNLMGDKIENNDDEKYTCSYKHFQQFKIFENENNDSTIENLPIKKDKTYSGKHKIFDSQRGLLHHKLSNEIEYKIHQYFEEIFKATGDIRIKALFSHQKEVEGYNNISRVTIYDQNEVPYLTLAETIKTIQNYPTKGNKFLAKEIITQIYDIFRLELLYSFTNCDAHSENFIVLINDDRVLLKNIDLEKMIFGKENIDIKNRFAGIKYMFLKEVIGSTPKANVSFIKNFWSEMKNNLEALNRFMIRSENDLKNQKHWPLHNLLKLIGFIDSEINIILNNHYLKIIKIGMSDDNELIEGTFNELIDGVDSLCGIKISGDNEAISKLTQEMLIENKMYATKSLKDTFDF